MQNLSSDTQRTTLKTTLHPSSQTELMRSPWIGVWGQWGCLTVLNQNFSAKVVTCGGGAQEVFAHHRLSEEGRGAVQPLKVLIFPCFHSGLLWDWANILVISSLLPPMTWCPPGARGGTRGVSIPRQGVEWEGECEKFAIWAAGQKIPGFLWCCWLWPLQCLIKLLSLPSSWAPASYATRRNVIALH